MVSVDGMYTSTTGRLVPTTNRHKEDMERRKFLRNFLRYLPKLPSHCCQATTSKEILEPQFQSVDEVHRVRRATSWTDSILPSIHGRVSQYQPHKDQCDKVLQLQLEICHGKSMVSIIVQKEHA